MPLPLPTTHLIIKCGDKTMEVEVFRCDSDGAVVFRTDRYDSNPLYRLHSGHKLFQPVVFKEGEIDQILEEVNIV